MNDRCEILNENIVFLFYVVSFPNERKHTTFWRKMNEMSSILRRIQSKKGVASSNGNNESEKHFLNEKKN